MNPAATRQEAMTFAAAQRELGMKGPGGRRLKRMVLQQERATGKRIAIHCQTKQPTYKITMSALRKHFPQLFPSRVDQLERTMRTYLDAIDEKIADCVSAQIAEQVEPRIDELWQRDEIIAKNVTDLAARVARLSASNRP